MKLSPRQQVEQLYLKYPQPRTFAEDERLYKANGYVIERKDVFVMGKGVNIEADDEEILDPHVSFPINVQDGWFLFAMSGNLLSMYAVMPRYLPWVGWARREGVVKWHSVKEARRHISSMVPMYILWHGKRRFNFC